MTSTLTKTAIAFVALGLAPMAPMVSGDEAYAHTSVSLSGTVTVHTPVAVVGFSFGDPFVLGHVHYGVERCSAGPLYYYPSYHVYGHYHPRYHYQRYARPVYGHDYRFHTPRGYDYGRHARHARAHSPRARHDRRGALVSHRVGRHDRNQSRFIKSHRTRDTYKGDRHQVRKDRSKRSRIRGH